VTAIILQEMSNADIEWLLSVGQIQDLSTGHSIIQPHQANRHTYLILNGTLTTALPWQATDRIKEFAQLQQGEILNVISNDCDQSMTIKTTTPTQVLAIEQTQLVEKLQQDQTFAAHFYRAQTFMLMQRLQALITQLNVHPSILYKINPKEASSLFTELQDSDLDWFVAVGQLRQLSSQEILQQPYRPIEALHIVLDGALAVSMLDSEQAPLNQTFRPSASANPQELVRLARGELFGEMLFAQTGTYAMPVQTVQVQAVRETELLSIPHWRLASRLLHDSGFALRFYQVLAGLLANKYQTILSKVGFVVGSDESELGDRFLAKISMAEARFELMMKRVQAKTLVEGTV
jgi:CRP-like cAMP-binding protein